MIISQDKENGQQWKEGLFSFLVIQALILKSSTVGVENIIPFKREKKKMIYSWHHFVLIYNNSFKKML